MSFFSLGEVETTTWEDLHYESVKDEKRDKEGRDQRKNYKNEFSSFRGPVSLLSKNARQFQSSDKTEESPKI